MKFYLKILTLFSLIASAPIFAEGQSVFKGQELKLIRGEDLKEADLKGKVVLLTNIATQCGYTGQLDDLESLYQKYKEKGLIVIGIPSNDFGGQTPEGNEEVAKFCKLNYGVTFPLTHKQVVSGNEKTPLFQTLLKEDPKQMGEIKWNFEKFLIDKQGKLIARFRSDTKPLSKEITQVIENQL